MRKVFICFSECFWAQKWLYTKTGRPGGGARGCVKLLQLLMGLLVAALAVSLCTRLCVSRSMCICVISAARNVEQRLCNHITLTKHHRSNSGCSTYEHTHTNKHRPLGVCVMQTNTFQFSLTATANCLCHLQLQLTLTAAKNSWATQGYPALLRQ